MTVPVLGKGFPAWWLRVAIVVAGAGVFAIPSAENAIGGALVILGLAVFASAYAPASPVPAAVVVGAAVLIAVSGDDPLRPAVLAMIPAVHLFHVLCGLAGVFPASGRLHLAALRRPALRFLLVQAIVFAMAGLAALLPRAPVPAAVEAAGLVGLVVIAVVVLLWQGRQGENSHSGGGGRPTP